MIQWQTNSMTNFTRNIMYTKIDEVANTRLDNSQSSEANEQKKFLYITFQPCIIANFSLIKESFTEANFERKKVTKN